jgi:RES domain-containing protein
VYTSSTLSLAVLELLVHLDNGDVAKDYVGIPADIVDPVEITLIRTSGLPREWRNLPRPQALADLGSRWAAARKAAMLAVPSAIVPRELNCLLNPLHPHFKRIHIDLPEPFSFNPRLGKP